jgi:phage terminase large subunit
MPSDAIIYSDKYQPLFDLLEARDEVQKLSAIAQPTAKQLELLAYYTELTTVDTVLMSGGRDSGKTFTESTFNGIAAADFGHRVLYTRYTMSSTDDSIYTAQLERLRLLGVEDEFAITGSSFQHKTTKGKIVISGQKTSAGTQTAKLKSLEDFSIFVTEEGEELLSYDEWVKVKRSMRATDVQCLGIIVFNPPTKAHWIYEQWYMDVPVGFNGVKDGVLYIHTTYLDNGRENMAEHNWNEYEALRLVYEQVEPMSREDRERLPKPILKKWREYKYKILGGFQEVAEGVIYEDWEIGEFDNELVYCYGLDFGSNDPDALAKVAIDTRAMKIYVKQEYHKNNTSTNALIAILVERVGFIDMIVADCENRRLINDIRDAGLNVRKAFKRPGSVVDTIKTIQGYTLIVEEKSVDLQKALNNYAWQDKKAGVPRNQFKHLPDAIGYAVMWLLHGGANEPEWDD